MPSNRGHKLSDYMKLNEKSAIKKEKRRVKTWKRSTPILNNPESSPSVDIPQHRST